MSMLQLLKRNEIDTALWDACISAAPNGLIYARSYYLDAMAENWDALVLGNYDAVMPLPWRRKFTVTYIYQPFFVSALGIFCKNGIKYNTDLFIESLYKKYKYWDIDFNEQNKFSDAVIHLKKNLKISVRNNYFLDLNNTYSYIFKNYRRLAKRKLNTALDSGLTVCRDIDPVEIINQYAKYYAEKHSDVPQYAYNNLINFCFKNQRKDIKTYQAQFKSGEIAAFYLLLEDDNYIYSLLGGSTKAGKTSGAFYLLTDAAIKDHSNSNKIFRFEGSDNKGIAFFNQQFGPYQIPYFHIHFNGLGFPLRLFKK